MSGKAFSAEYYYRRLRWRRRWLAIPKALAWYSGATHVYRGLITPKGPFRPAPTIVLWAATIHLRSTAWPSSATNESGM